MAHFVGSSTLRGGTFVQWCCIGSPWPAVVVRPGCRHPCWGCGLAGGGSLVGFVHVAVVGGVMGGSGLQD